MALTVAQVLKLRAAGAVRVVSEGQRIEVEFAPARPAQAGTDVPVTQRINAANTDTSDDDDPPNRDALAIAQSFNGPIPPEYTEDA